MSTFQAVRQEKEGEWNGPKMAIIQGVPIPVDFLDPYFEEDLGRFQTRHDDVFVTSYPKSGKLSVIPRAPIPMQARNQVFS